MSNKRRVHLEGKQKLASVFCTHSPSGMAAHRNVLEELVSTGFPKKGLAGNKLTSAGIATCLDKAPRPARSGAVSSWSHWPQPAASSGLLGSHCVMPGQGAAKCEGHWPEIS